MAEQTPVILGADGLPAAPKKSSIAGYSGQSSRPSYTEGVYSLNQTALTRSLEPFTTHPWVYASAMAVARNLSQAPFTLYQENKSSVETRRAVAKNLDREFGPRVGKKRTAVRRHIMNHDRTQGITLKSLDPDPESPYQSVFDKPNDLMTADQFWTAHWLWIMLRGECIWILLTEDGSPYVRGDEPPYEIFPLCPDFFVPLLEENKLVGWRMRTPVGLGFKNVGSTVYFVPDEVIQFKFFNPRDLLRGFSPYAPTAAAINLDQMLLDNDRSIIQNNGDPGGVLVVDKGSEFRSPEERAEFYRSWEQRHKGPKNSGRIAILEGMKWVQTSLSPSEMGHIDTRKWNREEELAVSGVPKTTVGVVESMNRASSKTIDKNFWDQTLIPLARNTEATIDGTLFYHEVDSVVGLFDFSRVEALKEGNLDKINAANILAGTALHVPPKQAFEVVGLAVPSYTGDEEVIVPVNVATIDEALDPTSPTDGEGSPGGGDGSGGQDDPTPDDKPDPVTPPASDVGTKVFRSKTSPWRKLIRRGQSRAEREFESSWGTWLRKERRLALAKFDEGTVSGKVSDINGVLLDCDAMGQRLSVALTDIYTEELRAVFGGLQNEMATPTDLHVDSPEMLGIIEVRRTTFVKNATGMILAACRQALQAGITAGESLKQLRDRLAAVFDLAGSPQKSLVVARAEATGVMNTIRWTVLGRQGGQLQWLLADDEAGRDNHVTFSKSGSHPANFNYMSLVTDSVGMMRFPCESTAPSKEVISCRCIVVAQPST